ncbi:hypothetical protein H072_7368 [Dactylellina haptotyla CBS 200.50]|uniref:Uncharacterized protein n=1 Tax=Dactylellina haptotyla (strain CBS 200.50) TaxID=1284197 RepID=S8BUB5_DACHA|nr:hypothetical protein H072_7368 [Dactylellina haptotyla CBS 200.50]
MHIASAYTVAVLAAVVPEIIAHGLLLMSYGDADPNTGSGQLGLIKGQDRKNIGGVPGRPGYQKDITVFSLPIIPTRDANNKKQSNPPQRTRYNTGCGYSIAYPKGVPIDTLVESKVKFKNIPKVTPGGFLKIDILQVNGDGAGPWVCYLDNAGKAQKPWTRLDMDTKAPYGQVPGVQGLKFLPKSNLTPIEHPFRVFMPANLKCTGSYGGMSDICMVRCQNNAPNGFFGGCIAIQVVNKGRKRSARLELRYDNPTADDEDLSDDSSPKNKSTDAQIADLDVEMNA